MTKWWHCPKCGEVTDEFESYKTELCPKCRKEESKK
jgi:predicted nucleic-acid-binding Zn-ribbon protein